MRHLISVAVLLVATGLAGADGLLTDPDFETSSAWTIPAGENWSVADDDGHSGSHCARFTISEEGSAPLVTQVVACRANTEYVLTAWLKSDGALRPAVAVRAPGLPDDRVTQVVASGEPGVWQPSATRFNSGGATQLEIRLAGGAEHIRGRSAPAGTTAIDDVQVWPASEAPEDLAVTGGLMREAPGENIALGCPYALAPRSTYRYSTDEGDATQLTDGVYSVGYFWVQKSTVGWSRGLPISITIDLGDSQPIAGLSYNTAAGVAGVAWPSTILVLMSDDAATWWDAGDLVGMSLANGVPPREDYAVHRFWTGAMRARGRYVKLMIAPGAGYCFCDEVEVYRGPQELMDAPREGEPITDTKQAFMRRMLSLTVARAISEHAIGLQSKVDQADLGQDQRERLTAQLRTVLREATETTGLGPDFQAIVPYTEAHTRALRVQSDLWRARGLPRFTLWQSGRWDPLKHDDTPPEAADAPRIDLTMMQNEIRGAALNITHAGDEAATLTISLEGLPDSPTPSFLSVSAVPWTGARGGPVVAAALPEADRGESGWRVGIPPGITRQIWLSVSSAELEPGAYEGRIRITSENADVASASLNLRVAGVTMPDDLSLTLGGWDYTNAPNRGISADTLEPTIEFLREYHVNAPWAGGSVMPFGRHADDGGMLDPPDTSRMDTWLDRWEGARLYCVFNSFPKTLPDTDADRTRVAEWITFWVEHLELRGIEPSQLCLLLVDEPHNEEMDQRIISYARVIHDAQPKVVIWEDPTWSDPRKTTPELLELCTTLCPNRPMWLANREAFEQVFLGLQEAGKTLAFYSCSGPVRALDPYSYHRLQAWECFRYGAEQEFFWAFSDSGGGSAWNEFAAPGRCFCPQYLGPDGCTTSKHMEGIREGLYDHEYLVMLRRAVADAKQAGRGDEPVRRGERLLVQGPHRVLDAAGADSILWATDTDRAIADEVRVEILEVLEALVGD